MPLYSYHCPGCYRRANTFAGIFEGPPIADCIECGMEMKRDYRADAPFIAPVMQETYSPSLGTTISDQRQVNEAMKRITEESEDRIGYTPQLVAKHRSEIGPAAESHVDPKAQAVENAMRAQHDGKVGRGEV